MLRELDCSLKKIESVGDDLPGALLEIEVHNGSARFVEPLVFRIEPKGKDAAPFLATRVLAPVHGRAGRTVPPGKRVRYPLQVARDVKSLKGAKVFVEQATTWERDSPFAQLELEAKTIKVGRLDVRREHDANYGQVLPRTSFELENKCEYAIDAILAVDFRGQVAGTALVAVRLQPHERKLHTLATIEFPFEGTNGSSGPLGVDARRVEVVDWSAIVDDGAAFARAELREAWEGWARVDAAHFPLRAPFRANVSLRGRFGSDGERFDVIEAVDGIVAIEADGTAAVTGPDGAALPRATAAAIEEAMRVVALQLARPTFDELGSTWKLRLVSGGSPLCVEVAGAVDVFRFTTAVVAVAGGAIVSFDAPGTDGTRGERWIETDARDESGWRLAATLQDLGIQGSVRRSFKWRNSACGLVIDRYEFHDEGKLIATPEDVVVTFGEWEAQGEPVEAPQPPTGPLAERLRAAWDGFYRYPDLDAVLRGSYRATNPGTDGVWIGRKLVEGTFELEGFANGFWRHSRTTVAEQRASESERATLASAVEDRILMWSGRELCWRPRFDDQFAGAALEDGGDGWIDIVGARPYDGVRVDNGRVSALRRTGGLVTRIAWQAESGALLPASFTTGDEVVELDWSQVAEGWWFPRRAHFVAVFGTDWGPETLEMTVTEVGE